MKYIIVKQHASYKEYPITEHATINEKAYHFTNNKLYQDKQEIPAFTWVNTGSEEVLFIEDHHGFYQREQIVFVARVDADIVLKDCPVKLIIKSDEVIVEESDHNVIYLNHEQIKDGVYAIDEGDILLVDTCKIILGRETLTVYGDHVETTLLPVSKQRHQIQNFPHYKRSPRLIHRVEDKKIEMEGMKEDEKSGRKKLLQTILPPLCMLILTVTIGLLMRRGLFILMSAGATGMTVIFSIVKHIQDVKEQREIKAARHAMYTAYLLEKRKEISGQWKKEEQAYRYHYPLLLELESMVANYSPRIYERSHLDEDFLRFSVGHFFGNTAFQIEDKTAGLNEKVNAYQEEAKKIRQKFSRIIQPQVVDLKEAHLGLVGEKSVIHEQLKYYVSQLSVMQSYHDVEFIVIYDPAYDVDFSWMRWLPHGKINHLNVSGLITSEKARDQVLGSMMQVLKDRKQKVEEENKEARFLPHYVFIIDEPKMIMDHSIMEFLGGHDGNQLGFSLIYTTHQQANLPENIETVLLLENSEEARLLLLEKELYHRPITLYRVGDINLNIMARNLGVLVHEQGISSNIPERITFFEMYGILNPEELQARKRWRENNASKTLAVPLGVRATNDLLELNLHEKAHGPHGLVAGTTGSGKSEIVQSYILSLAINFHPYEVGFLLIDYKGGGMANLFKDLPHLLGTITNLDGGESMRALASIQSELKRRQRVFGAYDVNHINAYNDLFKVGKAEEPIPHLFIISDEFAELKKEQPEFMKELVSTARIGRSLGVHLILATQKPTGVVDDQIETNSRFKLCLKVQNEGDSNEVLKTPDAANITQPGRAYLKVGNNETYELFQSAWSGETYIAETEKEVTQDHRVYLVNELGQGVLLNQDLRGSIAEQKAKETQLDVVVRHVKEAYQKELEGRPLEVKRPWMPPLKEKIVNPHLTSVRNDPLDLTIALGVVDVPEEQLQIEYRLNLAEQGNITYVASSGYGKSVFLANIAIYLATKNKVSHLNLYILDFGNNALIALSKLPHVAEYIMLDEEEKFQKFQDLMVEEIKVRKKLLATEMVQNFIVYNETVEMPLKAITILIDNYDAVREIGTELEDYFTKLSRDGVGLGIYIIMTASRMNAIRYATLNNFRNKIAGFNFDENEVTGLVGKSEYTLSEIRGRGMFKYGEQTSVIQLYTPVDFENEVDYSKQILACVGEIVNANLGEQAPRIPILPEELPYQNLFDYEVLEGDIFFGLDKETVKLSGISPLASPFLILGEGGSGKTNALKMLLDQIKDEQKIHVFDSRGMGLHRYKDQVDYISTTEQMEAFYHYLNDETKKRQAYMDQELSTGAAPQEVLKGMDRLYVIIDDIDDFCDFVGSDLLVLAGTLERATNFGVTLIVSANVNKLKGTDNFTRFIKSARNGLLLSTQGYFTIFPVNMTEPPVKPDGYLMIGGQGKYIKVAQFD